METVRQPISFPDPSPVLPALIIFEEQTAHLKVAALSLLDRLVVSIHRAGGTSITVVARTPLPMLRRAQALAIPVQTVTAMTFRQQPTLVAASGLLVTASDIRMLLLAGGRLSDQSGSLLPIGLLPPGEDKWEAALDALPALVANNVAVRVNDKTSAARAEHALWNSLKTATDGFVDRVFNRPCGRPLSKLLIRTEVSPNTVTLLAMLVGITAAGCFAFGTPRAIVLGAVLLQLSAIVDCVDGDIARVLFKESPRGKWLDLVADQIVHIAVFAGIAAGLVRTNAMPSALWLGLSAVVGAGLSFAVVIRGMRQPADNRTGLPRKLIESATNRDFSVLVFVLACFQALEWFLWLAALGSHLFWMAALALQIGRPRRAARA